MLAVRDHGVEDYAKLPHMDTTDVGVLGGDDRACLEELGQYLVATDAWPRIGVWLLHKHFEPAPGEVFVERALHTPRKTETTPVARSAFAEQGLRTTAIRFADPISCGVDVIGMEFAQPADFGDTPALSNDDEAVLAGIAERLRAHGKIDRLGVRLIRNPLGISGDELLHETCDSGHRTLHCDVRERDAILSDQAIVETAWQWKVVQGVTEPTVMQECVVSCVRTVAGEGHDVAHTPHEPDVFD
jgi:hypothetical protein